MCSAYNEKLEKRNNGRNRISKSGKNLNVWREENHKYLGISKWTQLNKHFFGEKGEMVNHIISRLTQKEYKMPGWERELCKRLKLEQTTK